jgi:hypothetical protein
MPAAFQHVERPHDVAAHVGVRIFKRVAHAGLGGEVHHAHEFLALEKLCNARVVGKIELHEAEFRVRGETREACLLERDVVVSVEAVETDDLVTARQKALRGVETDESGGARDENLHSRPSTAAAEKTCLMS